MRRAGGTILLCLLLSGCSVIDAATGGGDDDDDDDGPQCAKTGVCYDTPETLTPPIEARHLVTGSFDQDGTPDLALVDNGGDIFLLLNDDPQIAGSLSEEEVANDFPSAPDDFAAGDFDGDGTTEMLGSFTADNLIQLRSFEGAPSQVSVDMPSLIRVGDFNGDEIDDAAIASELGGVPRVVILRGRSAGGFETEQIILQADEPILDLAVGNFDSDADLDIAVISPAPDSHVQVFENDTGDAFTAHPPFAPCLDDCPPDAQREDLVALVAGDFDGSGVDDLAVQVECGAACDTNYHKLRFLESGANDEWMALRRFDLSQPIEQLRAADMDNDFFIDVMWQENRGEPVLVFLYQDYFTTGSGMPGELGINDAFVDTVLVDLNEDDLRDIAAATATTQVDVILTE